MYSAQATHMCAREKKCHSKCASRKNLIFACVRESASNFFDWFGFLRLRLCVGAPESQSYKSQLKQNKQHESASTQKIDNFQSPAPLTHMLIERNPPPRGGFLFTVFPIKNPEIEDPPLRICTRCFVGGPLPPGSWSGNIVNRKHPRGGGFFRSILCAYKYIMLMHRVKGYYSPLAG